MCLLTFLPAGVLPDLTALPNGALLNDDGHGFAIVTGDRLLVRHGMDAEEMIDAFAAARSRAPSRAGAVPLPVRDPRRHRPGQLPPVPGRRRRPHRHRPQRCPAPRPCSPPRTDPRSDTRITAEEFLPAFGSLRLRRNRLRLQRWMGPDNKIVILTVDRRFTGTGVHPQRGRGHLGRRHLVLQRRIPAARSVLRTRWRIAVGGQHWSWNEAWGDGGLVRPMLDRHPRHGLLPKLRDLPGLHTTDRKLPVLPARPHEPASR